MQSRFLKMDAKQQWSIFSQCVEKMVGEAEIQQKLSAGKSLRVKLGVDPTRPDLTFGHWVVFNKLRQLQELGHHIIFLIGDYTTQIGDPSGRSSTRPMLTREQIEENAKTYLAQAFKVLDPQRTETRRNSEWFGKMTFGDLLSLTRHVTVAQLLERDDFTKRYQANTPIALIEFLYPILQAYDSVMLKADIELGGMDQLFNLCMGRQFQKLFGQEEQGVICMPLLVGLDGVKKMSKSFGNYIAFNDSATDMYGKIMSIPDDAMWTYFQLLLLESPEQIEARKLEHPMLMKKELAHRIVSKFFGTSTADAEAENFQAIFSQKKVPEKIVAFPADRFANCTTWMEVIIETGLYPGSKKELKRLIEQGGVEINEQRIEKGQELAFFGKDTVVRVGKRIFFRIQA